MDRTQKEPKETAIERIQQKIALLRWLEACPSIDGQAYYETAGRELEALDEDVSDALYEHYRILADRFLEIRDGEVADQNDPNWEVKAYEELVRDIEMAP